MARRSGGALLALLMTGLVAAGCGGGGGGGGTTATQQAAAQPGKGKPAITLGTKDFTEEFVLGELYKQALEAKGYKVNLKKNIGSTEIIDKALTSNKIDGYPEYLGVSVAVTFRKDIIPKSAQQTY